MVYTRYTHTLVYTTPDYAYKLLLYVMYVTYFCTALYRPRRAIRRLYIRQFLGRLKSLSLVAEALSDQSEQKRLKVYV